MNISREQLRSLIDTALGKEKADLAVVNGSLVNVYTGELQERIGLAIKGERIAYVGPEPDHTIGPQTIVLDAQGKVMIPGFIDGHAHLDSQCTVSEYLRYAIPTGTTTIITETSGIGNVLGYPGVLKFVENLRDQPMLVYALSPSEVPISPTFESSSLFLPEHVEELLRLPEVAGVGETFWPRVVDSDPFVLDVLRSCLEARKAVQGHSAGAKGNKLAAYAAAGVSSCHEPITVEEAVDRLRLGLHVMIREGSIRQDLEAVAPIKDRNVDLRRLILVSDGLWLPELISRGYLDYVVQKAIDLGFHPITAIQMATLNVAEHFGLDLLVGGIAPHRYANINVIPDLETVTPDYVISKGRVVAKDGKLLIAPRTDEYPEAMKQTVHLPARLCAEDFRISAPASQVKARVITIVRDMITGELQMDVSAPEGVIHADPRSDVLKVAIINRHDGRGQKFVGLIRGFGLRAGAYAASLGWDANNIAVVGASELDMAAAVNRIHELQGGIVLCEGGVVYEEIPLQIGGIMSELAAEAIVRRSQRIDERLRELGSKLPNPFLSLQTLAFTPLPFLRVTENGLLDVRQKRLVSLFVD